MEPKFIIRAERHSKEDIIKTNKEILYTPNLRKLYFLCIVTLIFGLMLFFFLEVDPFGALMALMPLIIGTVYVPFLPKLMYYLSKRRDKLLLKKNIHLISKEDDSFKTQIYVCDDRIIYFFYSSLIYENIKKIIINDDHFIICYREVALFIKKENFTLGTPEELLEFIKTKTKIVKPEN